MKKKIIIIISACVLAVALMIGGIILLIPYFRYNMANIYINRGEYKKAYDILSGLDYKDSKEKLKNFSVKYQDIEILYYNGTDTDTMKHQKQFSTNGDILTAKSIRDGQTSEVKYFYDEKGRLDSVEQYENGAIEGYTLYKYDDKGNQTHIKWYDSLGHLLYLNEYEYDAKGNITKELFRWENDDELVSTYEYEFYDSGKIKTQTRKGETEYIVYSYAENGNILEEMSCDIDGSMRSRYKYYYDKHGNETKVEQYNEKNELCAYSEYEYDGEGNVTLKRDYENGSLTGKSEYKYQNPVYCYREK